MQEIKIHNTGFVKLIDVMGSDKSIEQAARQSYGEGTRKTSDTRNLLRYLMRNHHSTPFEMASAIFQIKMPIFVARQWIRHRTACISGDSELYFHNERISLKDFFDEWNFDENKRNHLKQKNLMMLNEETQDVEITHVKDIWQSGVKSVYELTVRNDYNDEQVKSIKTSKDHLFWTNKGWKKLEEFVDIKTLSFSDTEIDVSYGKMQEIKYIGEEMTYDISVSGPFHNFICNGFVVHNSVNEYSCRYSEAIDEFYIPDKDYIQQQSDVNKQGREETGNIDKEKSQTMIVLSEQESHETYKDLLDSGVSRELARVVLPVSNYTIMTWKMNLRNLLHFLQLRMDSHAQIEIQDYAKAIYELIKPIFPLTCEAWEDYQFNAKTLSALEIKAISILNRDKTIPVDNLCVDLGMSLRETNEFLKFYKDMNFNFYE